MMQMTMLRSWLPLRQQRFNIKLSTTTYIKLKALFYSLLNILPTNDNIPHSDNEDEVPSVSKCKRWQKENP